MASALTRLDSDKFDLVVCREDEFKTGATEVIENILDGPGTLYAVGVDASANDDEVLYLKIWDAVSVDLGTDAPAYIFEIASQSVVMIPFNLPSGESFSAGVSIGIVTSAADSGDVGPTGTSAGAKLVAYGKKS